MISETDMNINYKTESEMFDQMADYYDKYRPGYPQDIIEVFLREAAIHPGDHLLEIGAGSGKATAQFSGKGLNITCIEPGARLTEIGCFSSPEVYRCLWRMEYTAEDYFGFVMTGNRFVQKSIEEKEQAKKDI